VPPGATEPQSIDVHACVQAWSLYTLMFNVSITEPLDGMDWMLGLSNAVVATVRINPTVIIAIIDAEIFVVVIF
jgi:hypothetical protein